MIKIVHQIFQEFQENIGIFKFYLILGSVILVSIVVTLEPLFFGAIISELETYYDTNFFDTKSIISICIFWLGYVIISQVFKFFVWQKITTDSILVDYKEGIKKYCQNTLDMTMSEYLGKKIGSIYKIIDRGTDNKLFFLFSFFDNYLFQGVSIIIVIIILFLIDMKMAFISLSLIPVMGYMGYYFISTTSAKQKVLSERWERIFEVVGNAMSNFSLYKTLGLRKNFGNIINTESESTYIDQMKLNKYWNFSEIYVSMIVALTRVFVLGAGIFYIQKGELTLAELFIIFSYVGWIYFPLGFIFRSFRDSVKQLTEVERMFENLKYMDIESESTDTGKNVKNIEGNIEFKNVSFAYQEEKQILKDITISIKKGEKIALVGNTGAGKSTIVNLLLRFWDVSYGEILLDEENIQNYKKSSLRSHIGVVSQDNSLFNLSIEENLRFANPKATKKDLEDALRKAEANFVFDLPQGIKTVIGERGLKLSGGEKQRISIARLFLKNPEILVLDEATSALDNKTERQIQKSLERLMNGKTSIIIAHRLSTIQHADCIYVLENGKVVESGKYEELIEKQGKFATLANPDKLILG